MREAIKPKPLPLHTNDYYVDAAPSAKENAFPDLLPGEVVNKLQSDDGVDPRYDNALGWMDDEEADASETEFQYQSGKLGASDDEASFAERRKADRAAAEKEKQILTGLQQETDSGDAQAPASNQLSGESLQVAEERVVEHKSFFTAGFTAVQKMLRKVIASDDEKEDLLALSPDEMSTARRRRLFLEQLAMGKSPDVVKNPWEYRRRS